MAAKKKEGAHPQPATSAEGARLLILKELKELGCVGVQGVVGVWRWKGEVRELC